MLLNFALSASPRSGPDAAGTEMFYLLICPVRFIAVATLLGLTLRRGGFGFLPLRFEFQIVVISIPLLICGVLSLASFMSLRLGGRLELLGAYLFGTAVPILWILLALLPTHQSAGALRLLPTVIAIALGILTVGGSLVGTVHYQRTKTVDSERRRQSLAEQQRAEEAQQKQLDDVRSARLRELHELPVDGPIGPWLKAAFDPDDDVRGEADRAIKNRPALQSELAELLTSEDRADALKYLWWKNPPVGPAVQQAFVEMLRTMPEWSQKRLSNPTEASATEVAGAAEAVVVLVGRIPNNSGEVRALIKNWAEFLQQNFNVSEFRGYQLLNHWLSNTP